MLKQAWACLVLGLLALLASGPRIQSAQTSGTESALPYLIDVWESDDGLPQGSVFSVIQTRDGYLWFGTLAGLVRFDGLEFTVFDEGNTPGLNSSRIVHLFEDSRRRLWVGTETAGIFLIEDGQVRSMGLGEGSQEGMLMSACEDTQDAVWLYARDGRLWRYAEGEAQEVLPRDGIPSRARVVTCDNAGSVWVGMDTRQMRLDVDEGRQPVVVDFDDAMVGSKLDYLLASRTGGYWRLAAGRVEKWAGDQMVRDYGPYAWDPRLKVSSACEDPQGRLVIGTLGEGIFRYDETGDVFQLSKTNGLSYNYVLSVFAEEEGSLWVGTDGGGLNRVKPRLFSLVEETAGWVVQSIAEDEDGGVWIGSNGHGVGHWRDGTFKAFGPTNGLYNVYVRTVMADRQGRLWAGTTGFSGFGMYQYRQERFVPFTPRESYHRSISCLHVDMDGQMWVGTKEGLVRWSQEQWKVFGVDDGLAAPSVRALANDPAGSLWIATDGGGVNRWRDGRMETIASNGDYPTDKISCLYVDGKGVLWAGTFGSGLLRRHENAWAQITSDDGLVSNTIGFLIEDRRGHLWIGSNAGLMRVQISVLEDFVSEKRHAVSGRVYGRQDGLPTRECTIGSQPGPCLTEDGRLWIPTIKGLVYADTERMGQRQAPPSVAVESIRIDGMEVASNQLNGSVPSAVTLPPGTERLEIHYTALDLLAPEQVRFRYRLQGYESDWTEAGHSRVARYSKPPPGTFAFSVTASHQDGVWHATGATVAVEVLPPFWKTMWFMTLATLVLLALIVVAVHYFSTQRLHRQLESMRQQEALEKERARIARDIHDQLGASLTQMNMLSEMIGSDKDRPEDVEQYAQQISQTAVDTSHALDEIVWTVNPSNDTLEGLMNYLCKHAQDYLSVAGLRCRLDIPDQLPDIAISPDLRHNVFLAAKEAITNVVRHAEASEVWLRLTRKDSRFELVVEDNGRGLGGMDAEAAARRHGLSNMRKRLEDVGGEFQLGQSDLGGAKAVFILPLTRISHSATAG